MPTVEAIRSIPLIYLIVVLVYDTYSMYAHDRTQFKKIPHSWYVLFLGFFGLMLNITHVGITSVYSLYDQYIHSDVGVVMGLISIPLGHNFIKRIVRRDIYEKEGFDMRFEILARYAYYPLGGVLAFIGSAFISFTILMIVRIAGS